MTSKILKVDRQDSEALDVMPPSGARSSLSLGFSPSTAVDASQTTATGERLDIKGLITLCALRFSSYAQLPCVILSVWRLIGYFLGLGENEAQLLRLISSSLSFSLPRLSQRPSSVFVVLRQGLSSLTGPEVSWISMGDCISFDGRLLRRN
jgi:hypothetical protein